MSITTLNNMFCIYDSMCLGLECCMNALLIFLSLQGVHGCLSQHLIICSVPMILCVLAWSVV